jgi:hypothetical protein
MTPGNPGQRTAESILNQVTTSENPELVSDLDGCGPQCYSFYVARKKNIVCKVERVFILGKHGPKSPHYEGNEI